MPKGNPGRLKDRFEIRGELVPNEYEYQQQHGEMTEQEHENFPPAETQGSKSASKRGSAAKKGLAASKKPTAIGAKKSAATRGAKKTSAKKSGSKSAGKSKKTGARKKAAKKRSRD